MNRTIKFRGKSINNIGVVGSLDYVVKIGDMVYGDLRTHDECYIDTGEHIVRVDPDTVGQFTGLHDKNGKEIYEGDIIEVILQHNKETASTYKAVVEQKEGAFGFGNKQGFCPFYGQTYETFKVIGNIHDNPELKEGGEK